MTVLISGCSINPDPNESGLFDSMYHLSKGTYEQRKQQKQNQLKAKKSRRLALQKRLREIDQQLLIKQQENQRAIYALKGIKRQQALRQQWLQKEQSHHTELKKERLNQQKRNEKLARAIQREKKRVDSQNKEIKSLHKERDNLREELVRISTRTPEATKKQETFLNP
jgi:hypothetical protein